jgi:hypothetical protein
VDKACAIPADIPGWGGFHPHPPLMCVVDRARGPHSCPTHAPFRPTLTSGPSSRGRESSLAGLCPVPVSVELPCCTEAAKQPPPFPPHYSTTSTSCSLSLSSRYLDVVSQHRQDAREGRRGLLVTSIRHFPSLPPCRPPHRC